jgi:2-keto-4-pentenoate hydratase/2-oxohepta-3-ene-1,7-dioic acid hydratase in catechol pathway
MPRTTTLLLSVLAALTCLASVQLSAAEGARFVRYGPAGAEQPGMLDDAGRIHDLSGRIADITPETVPELAALAALDPTTLPRVTGERRLGAPIARAGKIIAVGFNYRDHAEETGTPIPTEPLLFMKAATSLSGPFDPVITPRDAAALDYEVELAIVIGRTARYLAREEAMDHVAGFAVGHDVSERSFQMNRGGQFVKGKSADTFAPLGPWLVTPEAVGDVQSLDISSAVNGQPRQHSNTRHMIFGAADIVSYVSRFMTLEPGDVIFTGTPSGVGSAMTPPVFLQPGDRVTLSIDRLGTQTQTIAPPP